MSEPDRMLSHKHLDIHIYINIEFCTKVELIHMSVDVTKRSNTHTTYTHQHSVDFVVAFFTISFFYGRRSFVSITNVYVCVCAKSKSGDDEFDRKQPNSLFAREIVFSHTAVKSIVVVHLSKLLRSRD